jgi:GH25 family lysozyme M1 (1,4-beta-N-acetylmuramidase)
MKLENVVYLSFAQSGPIDGPKLKKAVSAVMIRGGQGVWVDPLFWQHYKTCVDNKIPFGIWWFCQPNMRAEPQIEEFLKLWRSLPIKPVVIAYDVEEIDYWDDETKSMKKIFPPSRQFNHDNVLLWCKAVAAETGAKVGIYTRMYYFEAWTFSSPEWYEFWLWIAAWFNYTGQVPPAPPWDWPDYKIHQYEGGTHVTDGVSGPTCGEYFNGTHDELLAFFEPPWSEEVTPPEPPPAEPDLVALEARIAKLEEWAQGYRP